MKLSKQERIGVLIIAVILIIGLGIFFFVVPKFEEVSASKVALENKQSEYQAAIDKAATKDGLKDDIIAAYEEGRNLADMFFEEMTPYELDNEVRAFIQYCKDNDINIHVDDLAVSAAGVESLGVTFYEDAGGAEYDLKAYATQGQAATEEEIAAAARRQTLMKALSAQQKVAASTATFKVSVISRDEYVKFVDIVNNYCKEENGKTMRKAMMIGGLSLEYPELLEVYNEIISEIEAEAPAAAQDALEQYGEEMDIEVATGDKDDNNAQQGGGNAPEAGEDDEDDDEKDDGEEGKKIDDILQSYNVTITFYCVERMQDPTEILDAQDAA